MLSNDIPPSFYILLFIQAEKSSVNIYFTANNHGHINGASKAFSLLEEKIWNSQEEKTFAVMQTVYLIYGTILIYLFVLITTIPA